MRASIAVRALAALGVTGSALVLSSGPAGAVTVNGPCAGTATIGKHYYQSTIPSDASRGNPMVIPQTGTATYQGATKTVTKPHHGHLAVVVGPAEITVYSWGSKNENSKLADQGTQNLKKAYDKLPFGIAGLYELKGYHYNNGALYCSGSGWIKFAQSPLSTPLGIAGVAGTAVAGLALIGAGFGRKVLA